ncbi:MAG: hypothetical protein M1836_003459 [Candelina mexicana]|nr:MAG: hypothetical protein M1836_003459 [Candelina mexicana]
MADSNEGWTWSPAHNQYYYAAFVNGNWEYSWQYPEQLNQTAIDPRTPRVVTGHDTSYTEASQPQEGYENEPEAEDTEALDDRPTRPYQGSDYSSGYTQTADYNTTWATTQNYEQHATHGVAGRSQHYIAEESDLATQTQQMSLEQPYDHQEGGPQDNAYILSKRASPPSKQATSSRGKARQTYSASGQDKARSKEEQLVVRSKLISGTNGDVEKLDKGYKQIKKASRFFIRGRVFMMLWMEPASSYATSDTWISQIRLEENVFANIRRFIVVQESARHCLCVPVTTYGRQGATKRGICQADHAIVYTGDEIPQYLEGEEGLTKDALQVIPDSADALLDPLSRVNFGKVYTVEHNVKVKNVGLVASGSLAKLKRYYQQMVLDA